MKKLGSILVILFLIIASGCSVVTIKVPITRPAEFNLLKFKRITVDDFHSRLRHYQNDIAFDLTNALVATNQFDVIDRMNLNKILLEHNLTYEGLTNTDKSKDAGFILDAMALISGNVGIYDYTENITESEPYKEIINVIGKEKDKDKNKEKEKEKDKDKNKETIIKWHKDYTRSGKVVVSVNFQITDLRTGKILYTKTIERTKTESNKATDNEPAHINASILFKRARQEIVDDFMRRMLPYRDNVYEDFFKNSDYPELEKGIDFAKAGYWDNAIEQFTIAGKKIINDEELAEVYYNLGKAYQYSYNFAKSEECFKKAITLYSEDRYVKALNNMNRFEADFELLKEQQ